MTGHAQAIFTLLFVTGICGCAKKQPIKPDKKETLRLQLTRFFTSETYAGRRIVGLWIADGKSLTAFMEKRYLTENKMQPNVKSKEEMREGIKNMKMFFRIGAKGDYGSLSIVKDNMGFKGGFLKSVKVDQVFEEYNATIKGKNLIKARITVDKHGKQPKFTYTEGNDRIEAYLETTPKSELIETYFKQASTLPGMAEH